MQNPIELLQWKQQQSKLFEEELMVISHTLFDLICFLLVNKHVLSSKQVLKIFFSLEQMTYRCNMNFFQQNKIDILSRCNVFLKVIFGSCYIKTFALPLCVITCHLDSFLTHKNVRDLVRNFFRPTFASAHFCC